MIRIIKLLIELGFGLLLLIFIITLGVYSHITTMWKEYYTEDELKSFVVDIEKAPKLSKTFYGVYDKLYSNERHKSMTSIYSYGIWNSLILENSRFQTSWFARAANFLPKKKKIRYHDFKIGWGLEKYTTTEKCFDFAMYNENKNLRIHYDTTLREINKLHDTLEILEYLVKTKSTFNSQRNPEKLQKRIFELKLKLNN